MTNTLIAHLAASIFFFILTSIAIVGFAFQLKAMRAFSALSWTVVLALGLGCFIWLQGLLAIFPHGYTLMAQCAALMAGSVFFYANKSQRGAFFQSFKAAFSSTNLSDRLWFIFPGLYFICRLFSASLPQQHNDALYYHLAASKLWASLGMARVLEQNPSFSQSTLWETVLGWPQLVLGTVGVSSHVVTQVFAQWMHFFWGQIVFMFLIRHLFLKWVPELSNNKGRLIFISWICTALGCIEWMSAFAKNDYVANVFAMASFFLLFTEKDEGLKKTILCGFFAGLAFTTKMSMAPVIMASLIYFLFHGGISKSALQRMAAFSAIAALAGLPIYARNFISTLNPFFPAFDAKVGSITGTMFLSEWWNVHNASFVGLPHLDVNTAKWVWSKLLERNLSKILFLIATAGLLMRQFARTSKTRIKKEWIGVAALQFILVASMMRLGSDGRYGAYITSILIAMGMSSLFMFINERKYATVLTWLFLPLGLMINIPVDIVFKIPKDYFFQPAQKYVNQFHAFQGTKNWMNQNIPALLQSDSVRERTVVCIADKANFYLDLPTENFGEMKKWERVLVESKSASDFLNNMKQLGYRFLFLQKAFVYPNDIARIWDELMAKSNKLKIHDQEDVMVLDLTRL